MQSYDYYSGAQIDPNDTSDQFAINARELYTEQQIQSGPTNNPYYTIGSSGTGYTGPKPGSQLTFYDQTGNPVREMTVGNNMQPQYYIPIQVNNLHYGPQQIQNPSLMSPNMGQLQTPYNATMQNPAFGVQSQAPSQYFAPRPQMPNYGQQGGPGILTYRAPGYVGNPALSYLEQRGINQPIYQYGQQQPKTVHVSGADPLCSGKYLFSADVKEQIEQLQVDMFNENQELLAKKELQAQHQRNTFLNNNPVYGGYYGGYYGYGMGNMNSIDPTILSKYRKKVDDILVDAENRRSGFNKNLSKLCHSWLGIEVSEEQMDKAYSGYTYTVPVEDMQFAYNQQQFDRLVPINTAAKYWAHDAAVTAEFRKYCPDGRSMNEFFNDATLLNIREVEEEERHRRLDGKQYYDQDIFHSFVRKYAKERLLDDSAIDYSTASKGDIMKHLMGKTNLEEFKEAGINITDDGHFTYKLDPTKKWDTMPESLRNIYRQNGEAPPEDTGGPVVQNENVLNYQYNRSKFFQSIFENDKKINYDNGAPPPVTPGTGGG